VAHRAPGATHPEGRERAKGGEGKGGRGIKSGWFATPMARYREEGTGEKAGRAVALCAI